MGVPRSVMLGRAVEDGGPEWLEEDGQAAIAWLAYQDSVCPGCGQNLDETMGRDNWDTHIFDLRYCDGCRWRQRGEEAVNDRDDSAGWHVVVRKDDIHG